MNWGVETVDGCCPYCGEPVQLLVAPADGTQRYVEDCQVCCRPMVVEVTETDPPAVRLRHEDEA